MFIPGEKCSDPADHVLPSLPTFPQNNFVDNNVQNIMKLKLQLFPIDEPTRRALEMVSMKEIQQASYCSNVKVLLKTVIHTFIIYLWVLFLFSSRITIIHSWS